MDIRLLEAQKMADDARAGLRALLGPEAPADLDVDDEPLDALNVPQRPLAHYEEQARLSRPEVRALDNLVASKRALSDLERRRQYPDLVLIGSASYAHSTSIDNPKNAFYNDPFNTIPLDRWGRWPCACPWTSACATPRPPRSGPTPRRPSGAAGRPWGASSSRSSGPTPA